MTDMTTEFEVLDTLLPDELKTAMENVESYKIASLVTGLPRFEFQDIAEYLGTKTASRNLQYRPVVRGLLALNELKD